MQKKPRKLNLENSLRQLEAIVDAMESDDLELEEALKQFDKGAKLIQNCQKTLQQAEQKVQILTEKTGEDVDL